jgi:hypothetical protein
MFAFLGGEAPSSSSSSAKPKEKSERRRNSEKQVLGELQRHVAAWRSEESGLTKEEMAELRFWMPTLTAERVTLWRYLYDPLRLNKDPELSSAARVEIIDATLKLLREALSFRVKNEVSRIFEHGFFPEGFGRRLGLDLGLAGWNADDGIPLVIANLATCDANALNEAWRIGDKGPDRANLCVLWYVRLMEYINLVVLPERSKQCGRELINVHLNILGSYGKQEASIGHLCRPLSLSFLQGMLATGCLLYPDIAETVVIWKPPWIASRIYALVSPLVDPAILAKTVFLSSELGEKKMRGRLDAAPECLGGHLADSCIERDFELHGELVSDTDLTDTHSILSV